MIDSADRVAGRVPYVLNVELPGMLVGRILRSPFPHARLVRVDVSQAERLPGVVAVASRADLADRERIDPFFGPLVRDQPLLAMKKVRYAGEAVAAVAALDEETAQQALDLIEVEYDELPAVFDPLAALEPDAPRLHGDSNLAERFAINRGDLERGFAEADLIVEEEYRCPPVQHVPLEPHVCLAQFTAGKLTVRSATQTPYVVRSQLADIFKLPQSQVRVVVHTLGGAYGSKCYPKLEPITALLAWKAQRPVKIVLDRSEDFLATSRSGAVIQLKSGVKRDGTLVARQVRCYFNKGAYTETGPRIIRTGGLASSAVYRLPNLELECFSVFTNLVPSGPFRAPGAAQAGWASECHMDAIARQLGMDPLELRRKNLVQDGDRYVGGGELEDLHLAELLDTAARAIRWDDHQGTTDDRRPTTEGELSPQDEGWPDLIEGVEGAEDAEGEGGARVAKRQNARMGSSVVGAKRHGKALALALKTSRTPSTSTAACKLNEDGSLSVLTSSVEMGQGARTVLAQIAADALDIPLERVWISEPDTDVTPFDHSTSSSRTTYSMGTAIRLAADDVRRQLGELAAGELEVAPDDVVLADGLACVKGAPDRRLAYADLVRRSRRGNLLGHGTFTSQAKPDPETGQPGVSAHWHHAAAAAEVDVDTETGRVEVLRLHAGVFAGRIINPAQCELQVEGSVAFGLGQALMEEMAFDDGRLTNPNLSDYMIPSAKDLPPILTTNVLEVPGSDEVHGIGETALPPAVAAITSAVADAIGAPIRELPLTPERVLRALQDRAGR